MTEQAPPPNPPEPKMVRFVTMFDDKTLAAMLASTLIARAVLHADTPGKVMEVLHCDEAEDVFITAIRLLKGSGTDEVYEDVLEQFGLKATEWLNQTNPAWYTEVPSQGLPEQHKASEAVELDLPAVAMPGSDKVN